MGYDNEISLKQIDKIHIQEVEEFARSKLLQTNLIKPENKAKYFGLFAENPESFFIVPGHRILLNHLQKEINHRSYLKSAEPKKNQSRNAEVQRKPVSQNTNSVVRNLVFCACKVKNNHDSSAKIKKQSK